jgi:transcriptional regulator with XRE-family HTH domain
MTTTKDPQAWADLGQWIALRRKQMGMDQRQLAEVAGVSENTISNYERGRVPARGKVPAGYYRVEKALKFGRGSIDQILAGNEPTFEVDGPATGRLRLRSPEEIDDPLLRAVTERIDEAMTLAAGATLFADLASRWNASEELIEKYKEAQDDLLANIFTVGHGPIEVQRYHEARMKESGELPEPIRKRPDLGWFALGVDIPEEEPDGPGHVLRRARDVAGLSCDELSDRTGVPVRIMQLIEADTFNFPGAYMHAPVYIKLLSDALNVDPEPLIERFKAEHTEQVPEFDEEEAKKALREEMKRGGFSEKDIQGAVDNWDHEHSRKRKARGE